MLKYKKMVFKNEDGRSEKLVNAFKAVLTEVFNSEGLSAEVANRYFGTTQRIHEPNGTFYAELIKRIQQSGYMALPLFIDDKEINAKYPKFEDHEILGFVYTTKADVSKFWEKRNLTWNETLEEYLQYAQDHCFLLY